MNNRDIERYTEIIENSNFSDKERVKAYNNRGNAYRRQKEYEPAIADFIEAIALATDNETKAIAYFNRSFAYFQQKKYELAIKDFTQTIDLFTYSNQMIQRVLREAKTNFDNRDYSEAIEKYQNIIPSLKENEVGKKAYQGRSDSYLKLGKHNESIADHKKAIDLDRQLESAKLYLCLAETKKAVEESNKVKEEFQSLYGDAGSIGLATGYEKQQDKLNKYVKKCTIWFIVGIGALIAVALWQIFCNKDSFSLTTILTALPLLAPIIWLTSFFAKRRSEANMLLQEYSHKTIFAKSYSAYKQEIENLKSPDLNLQPKLLAAMIDTIKHSPKTIFSKKHSSDLPIEELKQIIELAKTLKS